MLGLPAAFTPGRESFLAPPWQQTTLSLTLYL
jgi:hypothetical protein